MIDPASTFATGSFYLTYVQDAIIIRFADCFSFRFLSMFVGALVFLLVGESLLPCAPRVGTMNSSNIMHHSDS